MANSSVDSTLDTGGLEHHITEDAMTRIFGIGPPMQKHVIPYVAAAIKRVASANKLLDADQVVARVNGLENYDVEHSKGSLSIKLISIRFSGEGARLNHSMDYDVYMQTGTQGPVHFMHAKSKTNLVEDGLKVKNLVASDQCFFELFLKDTKDLKADTFGPEWKPKEKKGVKVGELIGDVVKITIDHPEDTRDNFGEVHMKATWIPDVEDAIHRITAAMLTNKITQIGGNHYRLIDWRDAAANGRPGNLAIGVAKLRLNDAFDIFSSDPYLKIVHGDKVLYTCQTVENVTPFVWVEWHVREVFPNLRATDKLKFVVLDKNMLMTDTFVGQIEVTVEDLWKGGATWFTVSRDHSNSTDEAYIYVQADWCCPEAGPKTWSERSRNVTVDTQLTVAGLTLDDVTQQFQQLDKDGNGSLDRAEFFEMFKKMDHIGLDPELATKKLDDFLEHYGFDRKDKITFDEFVLIVCHIQQF